MNTRVSTKLAQEVMKSKNKYIIGVSVSAVALFASLAFVSHGEHDVGTESNSYGWIGEKAKEHFGQFEQNDSGEKTYSMEKVRKTPLISSVIWQQQTWSINSSVNNEQVLFDVVVQDMKHTGKKVFFLTVDNEAVSEEFGPYLLGTRMHDIGAEVELRRYAQEEFCDEKEEFRFVKLSTLVKKDDEGSGIWFEHWVVDGCDTPAQMTISFQKSGEDLAFRVFEN